MGISPLPAVPGAWHVKPKLHYASWSKTVNGVLSCEARTRLRTCYHCGLWGYDTTRTLTLVYNLLARMSPVGFEQ